MSRPSADYKTRMREAEAVGGVAAESLSFLRVEFDPPMPVAGTPFHVKVILNRSVVQDLSLKFEKQHVKFEATAGFFPELRPTGQDYFPTLPENIKILVGQSEVSTEFVVRRDALDGDTGLPLA